jgi:hypothetical protein
MTDSSSAPLTTEAAAAFINVDTTWAPGWSVSAVASTGMMYGSNDAYSHLLVTLRKTSRDSSSPSATGTYHEPWELTFPLAVPDFAMEDKDALVFWLLEKITWCDEHENREFARYRQEDGTWYAPFHPHRGYYSDQSKTPEWQAQYRDPADVYIAGRK